MAAAAPSRPSVDTLAEAIAAEIHGAGIGHVFGIPGGEVLALIDALRVAGTEFVLCNHESSAGMMAAAYGLLSGNPGVVLTTLGPGAANLLLPVANAQLDREPLVAICGRLAASWPPSHTHQRLELEAIFAPTTKHCSALSPADGIAQLRAALAVAATAPRGAALLTLSTEDATARATVPGESGASSVPAHDAGRDAARLGAALDAARRPLVIVGCGAEHAAAPALRRWLSAWELAVAVTPKAKGMVDEHDPRFVGVLDGAGLGSLMTATLEGADLIVGLGLDPVELIRPWHARAPVLWVGQCRGDFDPEPGPNRLASPVAALMDVLSAQGPPARCEDWTASAVAARRELADGAALTWIPRALRGALPRDAIVTTDVGSHKCLIAQFLPIDEPGAFLTSNGLSAMGYGLPAAIGAKLACPDRAVVAVVGDGGFAMAAQEIETAVRLGAPFVTVVLVDSSLSLIELLQRSRGLPRCGVDYRSVDVVGVAGAYGAAGAAAATAAELAAAVEAAVARDRPTVIAVPVNGDDYAALL